MASSRNVLEGILPEVLAARDILERDEEALRIAREEAAYADALRKQLKKAPELHLPLKTEPVEIEEKNVLTDPKSWLNMGLKNLAGNAASVILGEPSGNNLVDLGAANVPGVGAGAILAAGGMPGLVDLTGLGALKNVKNAGRLYDVVKNLRKYVNYDRGGFDNMISSVKDPLQTDSEVLTKLRRAQDAFGSHLPDSYQAKMFDDMVKENYDRGTLRFLMDAAEMGESEFKTLRDELGKQYPEISKIILAEDAREHSGRIGELNRGLQGLVSSNPEAVRRMLKYIDSSPSPTMEGLTKEIEDILPKSFSGTSYADQFLDNVNSIDEIKDAFRANGVDLEKLASVEAEHEAARINKEKALAKKAEKEAEQRELVSIENKKMGAYERRLDMLEKHPELVQKELEKTGKSIEEWIDRPNIKEGIITEWGAYTPKGLKWIDLVGRESPAVVRLNSLSKPNPMKNFSTFTTNPKKAAQEMVDQNLSIEDYLGENLSRIRQGQRKQVEDQLRKLGVDIPEEVVEQAPVVVKKEKPKEVQLPKSEKQRLAAIETAQKTWKKKPNDVFKSIDKGRTPEDYFKGAENIPEDFADRYAAHVAEKEGRKAEQAAQQEAARVQAEIDRQNAQATQKQLERRAAEEESRDAIARERERLENERAVAELFARRNSPEGVLESGWKPSDHPPMGGRPYPEYTVSDLDRRNHFFRDSVATQILKGFSPENPVTGEKMKDLFGPNPTKVVRHRGTNYDQMMANFYRELEDAKKAGRYTGPTSGADAMSEQMYRDSFKKQYEDLFSKAIDELFFRRPTTR